MSRGKLIVLTVALLAVLGLFMNSHLKESGEFLKIHNLHHVKQISLEEGFELSTHKSHKFPKFTQIKSIREVVLADGTKIDEQEDYVQDAWKDWKHLCKKSYASPEEEQRRFALWKQRFEEIEKNNEKEKSTFTEEENCFMDLTPEEWAQKHGGKRPPSPESLKELEAMKMHEEEVHAESLPQYTNWQSKLDLPIRHQKCGDCWANSATSAMEALWQIIGRNKEEFSVQEAVDCVYKPDTGCQGGNEIDAFRYMTKYGCIPVANDPYEGQFNPGDQCSNDQLYQTSNRSFISASGRVVGSCDQLKAALQKSPVSVGISATDRFQAAGNEVIPANSRSSGINHAVLLVAYTPEYWVIQNSWGASMGYNGYYRLAMGNTLQICDDATYPISNQPYVLQPDNNSFDFLKQFVPKCDGASCTAAGINLKAVIGTRFTVVGQRNQVVLQNQKGESLSQINPYYIYVPEGRDQTDFNFFRMAFIFINDANQSSFEIVFEPNSGFLVSNNIVGNTVYLGQCVTNNEGPLSNVCAGQPDTEFYLFTPDGQFVAILNWQKPSQ